ncbi:unnamed protein product [Onchocerca flexuosa]|uniref:Uncharacterized protein n=1 Tax=Onchocerca flexuosa TaxID=387005 RepID=A0A183HXW3_9BILA|nr:unnamed protein product [Onchocerca flexuosa]
MWPEELNDLYEELLDIAQNLENSTDKNKSTSSS